MSLPPVSSQMIGTVLSGRYRLEAKLGSGGMSTVYLARDEILDRPVAVKLMHREMIQQPDQLERFNREARAVAKLSNPNVVAVIDAGEDSGQPYIVLEYVKGETLKQRISRIGALEATEALAYALEVAQALAVAHARGMVHRDVKPQNVLIDATGRAKLTDFGISLQRDEGGQTAPGRVLGTTDYVAPEQAMGRAVDPRSDIYSLGIMLFEMLTGDVPFSAENQVGVAMKHVNEELPDVQEIRPGLSAAAASVIDRATAKNPDDRYQTIEEAAEDIQAAIEVESVRGGNDAGQVTSVLDVVPDRDSPATLSAGTSPWPAVALLLIALLVAGGTAWFIARGDSDRNGAEGPAAGTDAPALTRVELIAAGDFDPEGDQSEHPNTTGLTIDSDRSSTYWTTEQYATADLGGKDGVGLWVEAGQPVAAVEMEVRSPTPGWDLVVRGATDPMPDRAEGWTLLGSTDNMAERQRVTLATATRKYRYFLLWIRRPAELPDGGYGVAISDVRLFR